jgi:hypothetical protein
MTFQECVMECFEEKELVQEFNRLYGCSLGEDKRQPIEQMIDRASGHAPPALDENEARKFIRFVWNCIWLPMIEQSQRSVVEWAAAAQGLVLSDDAKEIRRLEKRLGCSREEAVDYFVEDSCCSDDLPEYVGNKGTRQERLTALRALWRTYRKGEETGRV